MDHTGNTLGHFGMVGMFCILTMVIAKRPHAMFSKSIKLSTEKKEKCINYILIYSFFLKEGDLTRLAGFEFIVYPNPRWPGTSSPPSLTSKDLGLQVCTGSMQYWDVKHGSVRGKQVLYQLNYTAPALNLNLNQ